MRFLTGYIEAVLADRELVHVAARKLDDLQLLRRCAAKSSVLKPRLRLAMPVDLGYS